MKKFIIIIILNLIGLKQLYSQNCECNRFNQKEKENFYKYADQSDNENARKIAIKYIQYKNTSCQLVGLDMMVVIYGRQGIEDSVKKYLDKQKPLLTNSNCNQNALMEYEIGMAEHYFRTNDLKSGMRHCIKGLKIAEKLNNINRQILLYNHLTLSYNKLGQFEKQMYYVRKSFQLLDKIENKSDKISHLTFIARSYKSYYWKKALPEIADSMKLYTDQVIQLSNQENNTPGFIEGYLLLNEYYQLINQFDVSLKYTDSAYAIIKNNPGLNGMVRYLYHIYFDKSTSLIELKDYTNAARFADSALYYSLFSGQLVVIASSYEKCYEVHKANGNYPRALEYHELFKKYKDSVTNTENTAVISEMEQKYEKQKNIEKIKEEKQKNELLQKDNDIKSLNNQILLTIVITSTLLILLLFIYIRQRQLRNRQIVLQTEMRLNRSRMNPHFIFNALTTLQGLAMKKEDSLVLAKRFHQFSSLMRQSLESTFNDFHDLNTEISFIIQYLEISRTGKEDFFDYKIECSEELKESNFLIPSMLIQPFIENSIEHGFKNSDKKGEILISFSIEKELLHIQILDNGKGITEKTQTKDHLSRATEITKDRFKLLSEKDRQNYNFKIASGTEGIGVRVDLYLPLLS